MQNKWADEQLYASVSRLCITNIRIPGAPILENHQTSVETNGSLKRPSEGNQKLASEGTHTSYLAYSHRTDKLGKHARVGKHIPHCNIIRSGDVNL